MLLSQDELIATLFRETDRAQRMKTPLAVILCRIDDPLLPGLLCKKRALRDSLPEIEQRITRLLRCYDSLGQIREDEFALVLPGCTSFNDVSMAERLKLGVFGSPVILGGVEIGFTAHFGIAGSGGRSSLIVLRNAEQALQSASRRCAGTIERCTYDTETDAGLFLIPAIEQEDFPR